MGTERLGLANKVLQRTALRAAADRRGVVPLYPFVEQFDVHIII